MKYKSILKYNGQDVILFYTFDNVTEILNLDDVCGHGSAVDEIPDDYIEDERKDCEEFLKGGNHAMSAAEQTMWEEALKEYGLYPVD